MIESGRHEALRRATAEVSERARRRQQELDDRSSQPLGPGDVCVFPQTADLPLEWAILERDPGGAQRILVVPADTNPVAGPADVVTSRESAGGPLHLRCAYGVWIEAPPGGRRSGFVEPTVVQQARARYAARTAEPGPLDPASVDVEYRDWIDDVVQKGVRALTTARGVASARPRRVSSAWATAASLLFALGLGFAAGRWPQAPTPPPAVEAPRERVAPAEPAPRAASAPRPVVNLPFVWLGPSETLRGPAPLVRVAPHDTMIVVVLQVDDPDPHRRYRLELRAWPGGARAWSERGLVKTGVSELALALPQALLPPGDYAFHLYDEAATGAARAEYTLRIARGQPTR